MTHVGVAGLEELRERAADLPRDEITLRVAHMKSPVRQRLEDAGQCP
jgi:hypothetical protein